MMDDLPTKDQDKNVLRWGGLAGILGGVFFLLAMVVVTALIPPDPADLSGWVERFPDIQKFRVIENLVYLVALLLEIPLFLALFWALRKKRLAPALFGSVLGIVGLIAMASSATPHVAHSPLSELYHVAGATVETRATLAVIWQATWGVFNAMLYIGFFVVSLGLILLGVAMLGDSAFGKGFGWVGVVLGALGLVSAILQIAAPAALFGMGSYFAGIIFYFVMGIKVLRLSKAP